MTPLNYFKFFRHQEALRENSWRPKRQCGNPSRLLMNRWIQCLTHLETRASQVV